MEKRIAIIGAIKDEIAGIKKEMRITNTLRWPTGNTFAGKIGRASCRERV